MEKMIEVNLQIDTIYSHDKTPAFWDWHKLRKFIYLSKINDSWFK